MMEPTTAERSRVAAHSREEWRVLLLGARAGIASLAVVGAAECVLALFLTGGLAKFAMPFVVLVALLVGSPIVLAVGLPCAALLWRACSGVRHESVHVALFGVLGAVLTLLALSAVVLVAAHGSPGRLDLVGPGLAALVLLPYGIVAAITTRIVAGRHAERLHVRRLAARGSMLDATGGDHAR